MNARLTDRLTQERYIQGMINMRKGGIIMKTKKTISLIALIGIILLFAGPAESYGPYIDNEDGTVTDTATGLIWQKGDRASRSFSQQCEYCDNLKLGGCDDWRMPRIDELRTIIDYKRINPALDPIFKWSGDPYYGINVHYFSKTKAVFDSRWVWIVSRTGRIDTHCTKDGGYFNVRCVRGGPYWPADPSESLVITSPNVVKDLTTQLMWQRHDTSAEKDRFLNAKGLYELDWRDARDYCRSLKLDGYTDWRLPSIAELQTIIDHNERYPAFSPEFFYGPPEKFWTANPGVGKPYWSATPYTDNPSVKWVVDFRYGDTGGRSLSTGYGIHCRCVRGKMDLSSTGPIQEGSSPVADAGEDIYLLSQNQSETLVHGTVSDPDQDLLVYRWLYGDTELSTWQKAGENGEAYLDLSGVNYFSPGQHILTLEVSDGEATAADQMVLTVDNSPPQAICHGAGTYQLGDPVTLNAQVMDYDGDLLDYEWYVDDEIIDSGQVSASGGSPVALPEQTLWDLGIGTHTLRLAVSDGVNEPVSTDTFVKVVDTLAPSLAPSANTSILWPPNHKMKDIVITANASDNSGGAITFSVSVSSNESEDGSGDGNTGPDWEVIRIDETGGMIYLRLRAERSGNGDGRIYTVKVTATDAAGNASSAAMEFLVPHDKGGKTQSGNPEGGPNDDHLATDMATSGGHVDGVSDGEYIRFGGRDWIMLDNTTGYVILKSYEIVSDLGCLPDSAAFDIGNDQTWEYGVEIASINEYLNTIFYEDLGEDKNFVDENGEWSIEAGVNDPAYTWTGRVALLTETEFHYFRDNGPNLIGTAQKAIDYPGSDPNMNGNWWLLTPWVGYSEAVPGSVVRFVADTDNLSAGDAENCRTTRLLRPTLHLRSGLYAAYGDGTQENPKSISDSPPADNSPIVATLNIDPDTLNLVSNGNPVTAYIELGEDADVSDIDLVTLELRLNGTVIAYIEPHPTGMGDKDGDGIDDLMVKFDRQTVQQALTPGAVTMEVFGYLIDGVQCFTGTDTITAIQSKNKKSKKDTPSNDPDNDSDSGSAAAPKGHSENASKPSGSPSNSSSGGSSGGSEPPMQPDKSTPSPVSATKTEATPEGFVTRFYQEILGREPDAPGLAGWANSLKNESYAGDDIAKGFVFSDEFINQNKSDEEFVTTLYRAFFNREPDPGGFSGWLYYLKNNQTGKKEARENVLNGFLKSKEYEALCEQLGIKPN